MDIEACMIKQNCKEAERFCTDAYPECECAPWDSIFTREESYSNNIMTRTDLKYNIIMIKFHKHTHEGNRLVLL
jgi:hypothetical protein